MLKKGQMLNVLQSIPRTSPGAADKSDLYKIGVAWANVTKDGNPIISLRIGPAVVLTSRSEVMLMLNDPHEGQAHDRELSEGGGVGVDEEISF